MTLRGCGSSASIFGFFILAPGSWSDEISSNHDLISVFCMICGQTRGAGPEGKPVPTHQAMARGRAFPQSCLAMPSLYTERRKKTGKKTAGKIVRLGVV